MGLIRLCVIALLAANVAAIPVVPHGNVTDDFIRFEQDFLKVYATREERQARFVIFQQNMLLAAELNAEDTGAVYGATKFADLTRDEFKRQFTGRIPRATVPPTDEFFVNMSAPQALDWRTKGAVTAVKNQGNCGSCWAFGTTGAIEGAWVVAGHKLVSLSEQQLIDCDKKDSACNGGEQTAALKYVIKNGGIEGEKDYKRYTHKKHHCSFTKSKVEAKVKSWKQMSRNEVTLAGQVATVGPVTIGINADNMQLYKRGVASPSKKRCKGGKLDLDHAVLIVGYDRSASTPYWTIKNSWGKNWGEHGYYRAAFGKSICGLNKDVQAAFA